jgi:hypothetical protein
LVPLGAGPARPRLRGVGATQGASCSERDLRSDRPTSLWGANCAQEMQSYSECRGGR